MKLLYVHDNIYFQSDFGQVYSQGQFPYEYFSPYVEIFDEVRVIGRGIPLNKNLDIKKLNLSSGPNIDFFLMPNINTISGLAQHYRAVKNKIAAQVKDADAIIIRAVSDLGWLTFKFAKQYGKPIAMEMAACAWDSTWNHGHPLGKIYAPMRYMRDKQVCHYSDYVMYVTQKFLQSRYHTQGLSSVASNVRIERAPAAILQRREEKIAARDDQDITVIGLIGTLSHKLKGIHTALGALRILNEANPGSVILKILGPGDPSKYRRIAQHLKVDHLVFFDGIIQTGEGVLTWLDQIDIYIQPSHQEGLPRAMIEAMSRGCPAIGSTAGGIPELLPPEWLHKPGQAQRLAQLIAHMAEDKELQTRNAKRNFEQAQLYIAEHLMPLRKAFWQGFYDHALQRKQGLAGVEIADAKL